MVVELWGVQFEGLKMVFRALRRNVHYADTNGNTTHFCIILSDLRHDSSRRSLFILLSVHDWTVAFHHTQTFDLIHDEYVEEFAHRC
jgi:hypothetical protein